LNYTRKKNYSSIVLTALTCWYILPPITLALNLAIQLSHFKHPRVYLKQINAGYINAISIKYQYPTFQ